MKKGMLALLLFAAPSVIFAQRYYAGFAFENQWGLERDLLVANTTSSNPTTYEFGSLGKGISLNSFAGFHCKEHFAIELAVQYFRGTRHSFFHGDLNSPMGPYDGINTVYIHSFRLIPSVRFMKENELGSLYIREGIVAGIGNRYYLQNAIGSGDENGSESVSYGGIAAGFHSALGATLNANKHIGIFLEINSTFLTWAPKYYKLTKFIYHNEDQLSSMTVSEKEAVYTDHTDNSAAADPDKPSRRMKGYHSMSSAGICMGMHFCF